MATIQTVLTPESLASPELRAFLNKRVEIKTVDPAMDRLESLLDREYHDLCAERIAQCSSVPTLEEVRNAFRAIPGSMARAVIEDREERF